MKRPVRVLRTSAACGNDVRKKRVSPPAEFLTEAA